MKAFLIGIARDVYIFYVGILNYFVTYIPISWLRHFLMRRVYFIKIGKGSYIHMGVKFKRPRSIEIGRNTLINPGVTLDGRMKMTIGDNVDIGEGVAFYCGGHDVKSRDYRTTAAPIVIGDRACIFVRATIVHGLTIGEGAVVGAMSLVNKDVEPYTIVAGIPAKKIGERRRDLEYELSQKNVKITWQDTVRKDEHGNYISE